MRQGAVGLLLLLLIPLIILLILFMKSKFIVPNPETIHESKKIEQNAQDTVNQSMQKSKENQSVEVENP